MQNYKKAKLHVITTAKKQKTMPVVNLPHFLKGIEAISKSMTLGNKGNTSGASKDCIVTRLRFLKDDMENRAFAPLRADLSLAELRHSFGIILPNLHLDQQKLPKNKEYMLWARHTFLLRKDWASENGTPEILLRWQ